MSIGATPVAGADGRPAPTCPRCWEAAVGLRQAGAAEPGVPDIGGAPRGGPSPMSFPRRHRELTTRATVAALAVLLAACGPATVSERVNASGSAVGHGTTQSP